MKISQEEAVVVVEDIQLSPAAIENFSLQDMITKCIFEKDISYQS